MSQKRDSDGSEELEKVSNFSQEEIKPKWGKVTLFLAISAAYICLACYWSIVGPTTVNLAKMVNATLTSIPIVFTSRSVGYVVGFVTGGLFLDQVESVYYRQIVIIVMLVYTACTALGVPYCRNITQLSGIFFASGIGLSFLDIALNTYVLRMWQGESNRYFQALHLSYGIGYIIGPILARVFITDIKGGANVTSDEIQMLNLHSMPRLLYAYVFLCLMLLSVAAMWVVMCVLHVGLLRNVKMKSSLLQEPNKKFITFAIITTSILMFLIGSIEFGYQHMLSTFAFDNYGVSSIHSADITVFFWGFYLLGCFITLLLAGLFHPHCLIIINNAIELLGGLVLIFLIEYSNQYLVAGNCIVGLGASTLFANTILWFDSYITISHKIMGIILFSGAIAELVIPEILGVLLKAEHRSLSYFITSVPILFLMIFLIQCIVFYPTGEKYPTDFDKAGKRRVKKRYCPIFLFRKVKSDDDSEDPPINESLASVGKIPVIQNIQTKSNEKEGEQRNRKEKDKTKPKASASKKSKQKKSKEKSDVKSARRTTNEDEEENVEDQEEDDSPEDSEDDATEDEDEEDSSKAPKRRNSA